MINNSSLRRILLSNSNTEKYKILTFPTHERYETQLCKTGHDFYSFNMSNQKKWNLEQAPYPDNYYSLPENSICDYLQYDFILVQSKFWQFQVAQEINERLNLPIICLEHTWPLRGVQSDEQIDSMRSMIGNVNVFISEASANAWDIGIDSEIIHHGIDINTFKPEEVEKNNKVLSVANDFIKRDYCLNYSGWKRVTQGFDMKVIGDTDGLSEPVGSVKELVEEYNKCAIFFNSSTLSPIPTSLLEAMACGCAVVSTATCMIPEIIKNGYNGFISNNENELREYLSLLLQDEKLRESLGNNARKTIVEKFAEERFVEEWNDLFDNVYEVFQI